MAVSHEKHIFTGLCANYFWISPKLFKLDFKQSLFTSTLINRIYFYSDYIIYHKEMKYLHNHFAENSFLKPFFFFFTKYQISKIYTPLLQNIFKDTFLLTDFRHLSKTTTTQHSHLNKTKRLPFTLGSCVDYQHKRSICSSQYVGTTYSTAS